jgi:2,4-dienoyl-CoA reductase (NADPH2)
VIASNRINTIALADEVLTAGDADFVSMARPFLADPEIIAKSRDRRKLNICIACNQACIDRSIFDQRVSCVVNPRAGYELELGGRAERAHSVAVVGGGPAGMEAARALAAAGHPVALFEAADRLGGQFRMACRVPGKEDFAGTVAYFEAELERLAVEVHLEAPMRDADPLAQFDAVVVATGVVPRPADLPGVDLPHVVSYAELLNGGAWGERVAIIGAGGIGVDVAHLVSHRDGDFYTAYGLDPPAPRVAPATTPPVRAKVTLMRRGTRVGEHIGPSTRWAVVQELRMAGVEILTGVAYERIEPDAVVIRDPGGAERRVAADTVVIAAGQEPETALARSLAGAGRPHLVIGGAGGAAELDAERAFREGARAPLAVAELLR